MLAHDHALSANQQGLDGFPARATDLFRECFGGILFFGVEIAVTAAMLAAGVSSFEDAPAAALIVRLLLWPSILGSALIWVSMWYFWFGFDKSPWHKKAIWFVLLSLLAPLGHAFYYFLVYRKAQVLEGSNP